jgi:hypothetical protein
MNNCVHPFLVKGDIKMKKPQKCFICGSKLKRTKKWDHDYCQKHEDSTTISGCSSSIDWGGIMECLEKGIPIRTHIIQLQPQVELRF